jgi:hypothetical protein
MERATAGLAICNRMDELTQSVSTRRLANVLCVCPETVRRYRSGQTEMSASSLVVLSADLRVSPWWLLLGQGPRDVDAAREFLAGTLPVETLVRLARQAVDAALPVSAGPSVVPMSMKARPCIRP